jgi:hypothetical protein
MGEKETMKKFEEYVIATSKFPVKTSIGHCPNCGEETYEGKTDATGYWHYRCQTCIDLADPHYIFKDEPVCPKCGSTAHVSLGTGDNNILKPELGMFECLNCETHYPSKDYERFIFDKHVMSIQKQINLEDMK